MPFVTAAGRKLEYQRIDADESKPVVVFLHEGLGSISQWRDFPHKVAAATGCQALLYARYGYGQSDVLEGQRNSTNWLTARLKTAMLQRLIRQTSPPIYRF